MPEDEETVPPRWDRFLLPKNGGTSHFPEQSCKPLDMKAPKRSHPDGTVFYSLKMVGLHIFPNNRANR